MWDVGIRYIKYMNCTNCKNLKPFGIIKVTDDMRCIECGLAFCTDTKVDTLSDSFEKLRTGEWQIQNPYHLLPRHLWLQDTTFGWTKEEIEQADYYIGNKHGIDCYITNPIKAVSK